MPRVERCGGADDRPNLADLRHLNERSIECDPLGNTKAWGITVLGLKPGKANFLGTLLDAPEEVLIRQIKIAKRLLECLTIDLTQPGCFRLLFEIDQIGCQGVIREALTGILIVIDPPCKCPVPDPPARTSKLPEQQNLLVSWLEAIAIGGLDGSHSSILAH